MPPTSPPAEPRACAVCGLVLNLHTNAFGLQSWQHAQPADHVPVAVAADQIRTDFRCDFCLQSNAAWTLPVAPYELLPGHMDGGDWAVCDHCARLIQAGKWDRLTDRAWEASEAHNREPMDRRAFAEIYKRLRAHITGPVQPRSGGHSPRS